MESTIPFHKESCPLTGTKDILEFMGVTLCCSNEDKRQERGRTLQEANMYRFLFLTRNFSVSVYESCVWLAKCDKTATTVLRVANGGGVRALNTSSVRLCEKNNEVAASNQDDKTNADKEADPTESPAFLTQKVEDDSKVIKMAEQSEEPVVLKADDESAAQQQIDVKTEYVAAPPKQVRTGAGKSGKESLLELLGAMKVEVTNKKKLKTLKAQQSLESKPTSKPAAMESTISMFQQATAEASSQSETLNPELVAAASAAASTLPNSSQAESELLKQLRQHEAVTDAQKKGDMNSLGVIIADMKVGKKTNRYTSSPVDQIKFDEDGQGYTREIGTARDQERVWRRKKLFSDKRLNIFSGTTDEGVESAVARPTLWDMEFAHQLSLSTNQMPCNILEEMIQWTKEGKMWQYPINNEAGLEEEASVSFYEHVFLSKHLEEGFPHQGPVRHFMELVVVGLSRNPYLTVQQKKEHISWFRDYFQQKEEVLKEADVYLN
ncbi:28S ribosomal protein S31, mitochondrial [Chelmon rostratus]|uniref:28S ribosomal protein S31, mitochondrial n=1 Tax=Chelmon rostratus TaxID=109905 RepID=UPI001BE95259|nr:28S ribosomal protein S31, mitochondrial [Chelmon rostratus]